MKLSFRHFVKTNYVPRVFSLEFKWLGHEADHSLPSRAEVKNEWSYISTPYYIFMAWCLLSK
jgi:hypothetical protein